MSKLFKIPQQKLMIKPWHWLYGFIPSSDKAIKRFIPKQHLYWTSSARNALYLLLKSLQQQKQKQLTIAMPAFTCHVVKEAIQDSGAKIIYYDNSANAEIKDIKLVLKQKPNAVILCYNFGYLPKKTKQIAKLCKQQKTILIEDCAQSLGASQNNTLAGGFGDYAVYSFGISKNIGYAGGILASNNQLKIPKQKSASFLEFFSSAIQSILGPLALSKLLFPFTQKFLHSKISNHNQHPKRNYSHSMFDKNIICHLAKKYSKILKQRQYNYFLLTDQNSTEACLYYNFFPKNKDITIKQAASKGIELDKLHSFKYLPDTNNFPKALKASQNHLAFALLRPAKDIQKIKKVIQ